MVPRTRKQLKTVSGKSEKARENSYGKIFFLLNEKTHTHTHMRKLCIPLDLDDLDVHRTSVFRLGQSCFLNTSCVLLFCPKDHQCCTELTTYEEYLVREKYAITCCTTIITETNITNLGTIRDKFPQFLDTILNQLSISWS